MNITLQEGQKEAEIGWKRWDLTLLVSRVFKVSHYRGLPRGNANQAGHTEFGPRTAQSYLQHEFTGSKNVREVVAMPFLVAQASPRKWTNSQPRMTTLLGKAIDDRGRAVLRSVQTRTDMMIEVAYDPFRLEVTIGNEQIAADQMTDSLAYTRGKSVLLEATTLGFAEIVLICKALRENKHESFDILYLEPSGYQRQLRHPLLKRRDFELSSEVPGYRAIPGSAVLLGDRKRVRSIFFLGYEEARLRTAFEELQMLSPANAMVAFGVPAFRAGWEMDAMANNISVIREKNVRGGVHFCGAENPLAVFELLCEVHRGLEQGERLVLAPIGTKPHGIGVALFAATHSDVGILYDHPLRAPGRSTDLGHWHLFSVEDFRGKQ